MLETKTYARKAFYVQAVQVTAENMEEIAKWCDGDIRKRQPLNNEGDPEPYIKVRVHRPLSQRQSTAFVGDWVLSHRNGFKVYTPNAFEQAFEIPESMEASSNG